MAMMLNTSVLLEMQAALVTVLRADLTLRAALHLRPVQAVKPAGRVYDEGTVPADLVGRWIAVGVPTESWRRTFMGPGSSVSYTLHIWHAPVAGDDTGKAVSLELWGLLAARLSQPLALTGHLFLAGSAALISTVKDPAGPWHSIVRYDALTQVGS